MCRQGGGLRAGPHLQVRAGLPPVLLIQRPGGANPVAAGAAGARKQESLLSPPALLACGMCLTRAPTIEQHITVHLMRSSRKPAPAPVLPLPICLAGVPVPLHRKLREPAAGAVLAVHPAAAQLQEPKHQAAAAARCGSVLANARSAERTCWISHCDVRASARTVSWARASSRVLPTAGAPCPEMRLLRRATLCWLRCASTCQGHLASRVAAMC